ncbi:cobalt transporter CbiM [Clostridium sp. cel8]|jgi:cobalt/nickel transport system permease protein|uniref:cobalt transporter CbiM n=1 Tax=unclassified Clostridium TaxID=2614128 RepID=UPI0015F40454|nr:cobalt transporter CbiM [Clostridium sp. cel8]MBA5849953.1 cobalt transporter CbiM [Clostridium sp. cel8]
MHIPDNYLSPSTCGIMFTAMVPIWIRVSKKVKKQISKRKLPIIGVCAAFSFLIMMFNVPIPGGTTGHAVGAVLAAILLGPYAATICVTTALLIQALFFGDGGILAFGANAFNMAFLMPFVGYTVYKFIKLRFKGRKSEYVAAFIGAYVGIVVGAFAAGIEFGIQPMLFKDVSGRALYCPYGLKVSIPAMVLPHLLIGFIEGTITAAVLAYVKKLSPGIIYKDKVSRERPIYLLLIALIVLTPVGLLAQGTAWGEWNAEELKNIIGYIPKAFQHGLSYNAVAADYSISGTNEVVGYIISALGGVAIILIVFKLLLSIKSKENKY